MSNTIRKCTLVFLFAIGLLVGLFTTHAYADNNNNNTITLKPCMTVVKDENATKNDPLSTVAGTLSDSTVTLSSNRKIEKLPDPTPPEGFIFIGWYTGEVKTMWWNISKAMEGMKNSTISDEVKWFAENGPTNFKNLKNIRNGSKRAFSADDFWSRLVGTADNSNKVAVGDTLAANVNTLYAAYAPKSFTVRLWLNGFDNNIHKLTPDPITDKDRWTGVDTTHGSYSTGRDYKTTYTFGALKSTYGYTFTNWCEVAADGTETNTVVTGDVSITQDKEVYATWKDKNGKESPAFNKNNQGYSKPTAIRIVAPNNNFRLDPNQGKTLTLSAHLQTDKEDDNPNRADASKITWSVDNSTLADIKTLASKDNVILTAKGSEGKVKVIATYNDGTTTLTDTKEVVLSHSYDGRTVVTKYPDCTHEGEGYTECTVCGNRKQLKWPANGHRYVRHTFYPTCTESGHTERVCRECGYHENTDEVPALGHHYKVNTISSCGGTIIQKTCVDCGSTEQNTDITQVQHNWAATATVDKEATCATEGSKSIHCLSCEVKKDVETIPVKQEHSFTDWKVTKSATVNEAGEQVRTCSICGVQEKEELAKLMEPAKDNAINPVPDADVPDADVPNTNIPDTSTDVPSTDVPSTDVPSTDVPSTDVPSNESPAADPIKVYRLYNSGTGEHLFTSSIIERNTLTTAGWKDEGVGYTMDEKTGKAVYRLYNPYTGEHFYTADKNESDYLDSVGWNFESVAFYAAENGNPVYRLYNPFAPAVAQHHMTTDKNEYEKLIGFGWHDEGVAYYTY